MLRFHGDLLHRLRFRLGRLDFARGDLFLGYASGLGGTGINEWLGAILELPGTTGRHDYIAKIVVQSILGRHFASCPGFSPVIQA